MNPGSSCLEIRKTRNKGRGVFALRNFKKGDIIEKCPIQPFPAKEKRFIFKTCFKNYYMESDDSRFTCIMFGWGSIYNHSYYPNAEVDFDRPKKNVIFRAIREIKKGEEVTYNYNGESKKDLLNFKVKN